MLLHNSKTNEAKAVNLLGRKSLYDIRDLKWEFTEMRKKGVAVCALCSPDFGCLQVEICSMCFDPHLSQFLCLYNNLQII